MIYSCGSLKMIFTCHATVNAYHELQRTTLLGLCEAKARMCTHRNRHTDTHRHTQTHTDTHRHTRTHTDTHRHTQTHTHTHTHTLFGLAWIEKKHAVRFSFACVSRTSYKKRKNTHGKIEAISHHLRGVWNIETLSMSKIYPAKKERYEEKKYEISKKETDTYAKIPQQNEDIYKQINQETHETKACNIHTLGRTQLIPRPVYRFSVFFWPSQSQSWN